MSQLVLCFFLMAIAAYSFYRHMKFIQSRTLPKWKNAKKRDHQVLGFDGTSGTAAAMERDTPSYSVADNDGPINSLERAA